MTPLRSGSNIKLDCSGGSPAFRELRVRPAATTVRVNDSGVEAELSDSNGPTVLRFAEPTELVS